MCMNKYFLTKLRLSEKAPLRYFFSKYLKKNTWNFTELLNQILSSSQYYFVRNIKTRFTVSALFKKIRVSALDQKLAFRFEKVFLIIHFLSNITYIFSKITFSAELLPRAAVLLKECFSIHVHTIHYS